MMRETPRNVDEGAHTMRRDESAAIAIDVGGSSVKCGVVDSSGVIRFTQRHPAERERGPDAVVKNILDVSAQFTSRARQHGLAPRAVGVVVPGIVDEDRGIVRVSANLGLRDVPLRDMLARRLALLTTVGHDVRAASLAESTLSAGRGSQRMLFVAAGTGVACGYVRNSMIDAGAHGGAGEIGHATIRSSPDARACACGGRGCLEAYASEAAVERAYAAASAEHSADVEHAEHSEAFERPKDPAHSGDRADWATTQAVTAKEVAARAERGEPLARAVWDEAVTGLADGLLVGIALFDPDLLVVGGGLAEAGPLLLDPLAAALAERRTFHQLPRLARAELGNTAGLVGAALLALNVLGGAS